MTKGRLLIAGVCAVVLAIGAIFGLFGRKPHDAAIAGGPILGSPGIPVKVIHPRKGALERVCVQPGSVQAFESVRLFAKVPGFLEKQTVDIGDQVKKGELLAVLYVPDIKAAVARNKAAVDKASARLLQMKAKVNVALANVDAAQAAVTQAEAKLRAEAAWVRYRSIQLGRFQDLVKNSAVEERLYDESKERYESSLEAEITAKAAIVTTKANVVASKAKVEEASADVVEAQAAVELARAELTRSDVDLDFAAIKAPFTGVVTHRNMFPGDFVNSADSGSKNIEPLLTMDRTDLFRVVVFVPERDVRFIRLGTTATMAIDSLPGRTFTAKVSRFAKSLDKHTRLMRVELDLPNPTGEIYNDMYGQVAIVLERGADLLSIPAACLAGKPEKGKAFVHVVRSGKAEKVEVTLVMDSGVRVAVNGLTANDEVILNPSGELSQNAEVVPTFSKE